MCLYNLLFCILYILNDNKYGITEVFSAFI